MDQAYEVDRLARVEAGLDASGDLTPENIKTTVMAAIHRAFCRIRAISVDDPALAGLIADAFHNLPEALQSWSHEDLRKEAVRALHALTIKPHLKES